MTFPDARRFERTIREQIALNRARTPTERFRALCDLLDAARAMAPRGAEARERRLRALAARQLALQRYSRFGEERCRDSLAVRFRVW